MHLDRLMLQADDDGLPAAEREQRQRHPERDQARRADSAPAAMSAAMPKGMMLWAMPRWISVLMPRIDGTR